MDKVKIALALLKKHYFWVMTSMVILLSFIGWFLATNKLWAEYEISKKNIEAKFATLTKINGETRENETWIKALEDETKLLKVKVRKAWDQVYTEQKTDVLKWPPVLGKEYVATLEGLGPTEEIPVSIRRKYQNYIRSEFPRLLKIVDARDQHLGKLATEKAAAGEGANATDHDYKVIWNPENQQPIYKKLDMVSVPNSREVREAQEDLWVYQALLTIVGNLNKFAQGNYNAKVKEIDSLLIGKEAATEFQSGMAEGRLERPEGAAARPPNLAVAPSATPVEVGRYVDEKGMSLSDAAAAPPEFKRMPIVMRLLMDQREISRLLVECANSPLPVEVRQFRTKKPGKRSKQQTGGNEKELNSFDVEVEVGGLIYIFNPPDPAKLGEIAVEAGGVPAAEQPAASNPNGGTPEAKANPAAGDAGGVPADGEPGPAPGRKAAPEAEAAAEKPDGAAATDMENSDTTDESPESK